LLTHRSSSDIRQDKGNDEQAGHHAGQKLIGANRVMGLAATQGERRWVA
jgi:hypothetical protein